MLKCHVAAIGVKNRQVCPRQSVAKIACDFRGRSNSPRSAYKIASCVAGFIGFVHDCRNKLKAVMLSSVSSVSKVKSVYVS